MKCLQQRALARLVLPTVDIGNHDRPLLQACSGGQGWLDTLLWSSGLKASTVRNLQAGVDVS